jgi:hypothetical protein
MIGLEAGHDDQGGMILVAGPLGGFVCGSVMALAEDTDLVITATRARSLRLECGQSPW